MIYALIPFIFKKSMTFFDSFAFVAKINPIPQLKVLSISIELICPTSLNHKNFSGIKNFSVLISAKKFLGTILSKFSKIPPPVMCAIAEIFFFFIRGKTYFTYIFVGSIKSSPKLRFEDL